MVPPAQGPPAFVTSGLRESSPSVVSGRMAVDPAAIVDYLKEWRPLECACCSSVFGFQNRTSGLYICTGAVCHRADPSGYRTPGPVPKHLMMSPDFEGPVEPLLVTIPRETSRVSFTMPAVTSAPRDSINTAVKPVVPPAILKSPVLHPLPERNDLSSQPKQQPVRATPSHAQASAPVVAPASSQRPTQTIQEPFWTKMRYSENLLKANVPVRIHFIWSPSRFQIMSEADEASEKELAAEITKYCATKPGSHVPVKDEIIIGEYDGAFYRGRVDSIQGDKFNVVFIDYGDTAELSEVFKATPEILKHPVYGLTVNLKLARSPQAGYKFDTDLEDAVYEETYLLDFSNKKAPLPKPGDATPDVLLWDKERENTLNEKVNEDITKRRK